jgi:biotin carboxyl carrier protein
VSPDASLPALDASGPTPGEPVVVRAVPGGDSLVVGPDEAGGRIEWRGPEHAILAQAAGDRGSTDWVRTRLVLGPARRRAGSGVIEREVLIDGWLVEVEIEPERRAALRARARRAAADGRDPGAMQPGRRRPANLPADLRADLPGRIAAISVAPGDAVTVGQPLLVIEAMKMLNEVRAPRAGVVEQVAVVAGQGVELGDLLVRLR